MNSFSRIHEHALPYLSLLVLTLMKHYRRFQFSSNAVLQSLQRQLLQVRSVMHVAEQVLCVNNILCNRIEMKMIITIMAF